MEIYRYFERIVTLTIKDFETNPTSVRHAFLAAVVVFHAIDYLPRTTRSSRGFRDKFRENTDFAVVDRIAHAFKHAATGHPDSPQHQPLSADGVTARPPAYWGVAVWDLSSWDDTVGGVTLDGERAVDVLSAIKAAAEFVRQQFEGMRDAAEKT